MPTEPGEWGGVYTLLAECAHTAKLLRPRVSELHGKSSRIFNTQVRNRVSFPSFTAKKTKEKQALPLVGLTLCQC